MINFSEQTFYNILARQLARVPNTIDKRETSLIQTALGPESWEIEGLYMALAELQSNGAALSAVGQALDYKAAERGVTRNRATYTIREGVFDAQAPMSARFKTINGSDSLTYYVTKQLGAQQDGYYHCELTCETAGISGNGYTGKLLPITFIASLSYAQLTAIIISGSDEEDDVSLRQRYLDSLKAESFAGNISYYRDILLQQDNVGAVQVYPVWQGGGTVKCSILDSNFNMATAALIEKIQNIICPVNIDDDKPTQNGIGEAPIGASVTIGTADELPIIVSMTIELVTGITVATVQSRIEQAIQDYFLLIRRAWDKITVSNSAVIYLANIYISRILSAVMEIDEVINVTDILLNGNPADLTLVETGASQQIPKLTGVSVNGG
jgi:uncharacterized phage protein gp47/JayE